MKKMTRIFPLMLAAALFSTYAIAGDGANNGGDERVSKAVQAFVKAQGMIERLEYQWVKPINADVADFFRDNKEALLEQFVFEAKDSPIELRARNENGLCGQTEQHSKATIYLSTELCDFNDSKSMAKMLMGEVVHHLGYNTFYSSFIALNLQKAFDAGAPISGTWQVIESSHDDENLQIKMSRVEIQVNGNNQAFVISNATIENLPIHNVPPTSRLETVFQRPSGMFSQYIYVDKSCSQMMTMTGRYDSIKDQLRIEIVYPDVGYINCSTKGRNKAQFILSRI